MSQEVNGRELTAIEYIAALEAHVHNDEPKLEERLKSIPDAWRKYRSASKMLEQVMDQIFETIPEKTKQHMLRVLKHGEIVIRNKPLVPSRNDYVTIVSNPDFRLLVNKAMEYECSICLKSDVEQRKCELRKALMCVCPPHSLPEKNACQFVHVARAHNIGDYFGAPLPEALEEE